MGSRGSSLVDYCIVNPELLSDFASFYVHNPNIISDYCLIKFSLISTVIRQVLDEPIDGASFSFYKWNSSHKEEYRNNLSSECFKEQMDALIDVVDDVTCENDIEASITEFSDLMHTVCDPLSKQTHMPNFTKEKTECYNFDNTCSDRRKIFYRCLNTFRKKEKAENWRNIKERTEYKIRWVNLILRGVDRKA